MQIGVSCCWPPLKDLQDGVCSLARGVKIRLECKVCGATVPAAVLSYKLFAKSMSAPTMTAASTSASK